MGEKLMQSERVDISNKLMEVEVDLEKANAVINSLYNDYVVPDESKAAEKMKYEAKQIMRFIEIVSDYVFSSLGNLAEMQEKLAEQR